MKIAFDARKILDTGIGTYIRGLLRELAALDKENEYFLFLPSAHLDDFDFGGNFQKLTDDSRGYSLREQFTLSWKIARLKPDLVHVPHYVMPMLQRWPTVVTIHDIIHLRFPQYLPYLTGKYYARYMLSRAVKKSAAVIAVSQATKDDLVNMLNAPVDKVRMIHNAVGKGFVPLDPEKARSWREGVGLPRKFVLCAGGLKGHKNVPFLIRSYLRFAAASAAPVSHKLVVTGRGSELGGLDEETRRGMRDHVVFLANVPEEHLPYLYNSCACLVSPSLSEGFGLPPLEAMSCGWPVIASDIPVHREVLGEAAEYFDPANEEELAALLGRLLGDNEMQRKLAALGRNQVQKYSWARTAKETLEVYESVVSGGVKGD